MSKKTARSESLVDEVERLRLEVDEWKRTCSGLRNNESRVSGALMDAGFSGDPVWAIQQIAAERDRAKKDMERMATALDLANQNRLTENAELEAEIVRLKAEVVDWKEDAGKGDRGWFEANRLADSRRIAIERILSSTWRPEDWEKDRAYK